MRDDVKDFLTKYNTDNGYAADDLDDLWETLEDGGTIKHIEDFDNKRWWDENLIVVDVAGRLIAYVGATTTGDDSPRDKGWEPNFNSVRFVELTIETKEVTIVKEIDY